jgi:hypothetical protein
MATAANTFWLAFAEFVKDVVGERREIIPLGHWKGKKSRDVGCSAGSSWYIWDAALFNFSAPTHERPKDRRKSKGGL